MSYSTEKYIEENLKRFIFLICSFFTFKLTTKERNKSKFKGSNVEDNSIRGMLKTALTSSHAQGQKK